jgi:hypothetical protein
MEAGAIKSDKPFVRNRAGILDNDEENHEMSR